MKVNIPNKYADLYIKALEEKKQALRSKIEQFYKEINDIDSHISSLTNAPLFGDQYEIQNTQYKINTYNPKWPWTKKITFYQEITNKLITTSQIVDFVMDKEPTQNRSKVRSSISAALSNRLKSNTYKKFTDPVTGTAYYGPENYFLTPQEPNIEYMSDELKERLLYNK